MEVHLELSLDIPELFLGLSSLTVCMAQLNLHLIEISLHFLLDSQSIIPAPDLRVQSGVNGAQCILEMHCEPITQITFLGGQGHI